MLKIILLPTGNLENTAVLCCQIVFKNT